MARLNEHYDKLVAGYLFPEINKRVRAFAEKYPGRKLYRLGIGNTTEPIPPSIIRGLEKAVNDLAFRETYTGYGDELGEKPLRESIAQIYRERGVILELDEIFVSDGAKPDIGNIQSIFALDNRIAVQDPTYPVYVDTNVIAGRTGGYNKEESKYDGIVYMKCTVENDFFAPPPNEHVDILYLCSPNNPTGAVATREQLSNFISYALEHKAVIIFDAAYSAFIRDPQYPHSIYELENARACAIEINSFSKIAGFTGVRLGWTVVPKTLVLEDGVVGKANALWQRRQTTFFNGASIIAQKGGVAALTGEGRRECALLADYYLENASIIKRSLERKGLSVYGGTNAPYLWVKTPGSISSWDFFEKLLNESSVVVTPGVGFGPSGEGFVRFSAFGHREDILEAVESIEKNLKL
ncbi:MAG: LL-diaminopimelate aminotransferase [Bacteroidetes bacterium]|nr:LL-diaminopimelate aminotransferase [Bacteroidota bacterium]